MKYRKKPVVIDALKWTGENVKEIISFCPKHYLSINESPIQKKLDLHIYTLEGRVYASHGDFIIKGIKGEFYPCRADIFEMTYEKVT